MKFRKTARTGTRIIAIISSIILILLLIMKIIPNVDVNTLNTADKMLYEYGIYKGKEPMWKNICFGIVCVLLVLELFIYFLICRCNYCGRYVGYISIREKYCSYCSKELDKTEEEIEKEINNKKE